MPLSILSLKDAHTMSERSMPLLMKKLHELKFDYARGNGFDFEPYPDFLSESETRDWIRTWTGNGDIDGGEFLVFGQDGTGGLAAFWNTCRGVSILDLPVVFLGSEGAAGVVARNFAEYLWLLANGVGPSEAVEQPNRAPAPDALTREFRRFAEAHAGVARHTAVEVLDAARREFPDFVARIKTMCR
jgi:hypothetical protein